MPTYKLIDCSYCGENAPYMGNCSNDIIMETGFHIDTNGNWLCPECYKLEYVIHIVVSREEFINIFNREPESPDELYDFYRLCDKGVRNQIDWDIILKAVLDETERK